jgi:membrane protein required for colicin V production
VTALDFVVIGIIVLSGIFAYARGFVREVLSIAAWILAAIVAYYAFPYALPFFERFLPRGAVAGFATGAALFLVALMILHVVAKMLASHVKRSALSPIDRTLGLIFGLARGVVLACLGYMILAWFWPPGVHQPPWFVNSRTRPYLQVGANTIESYFSHAKPGGATSNVENEAESAINALTKPTPSTPPPASDPPTYTQGEQRDLNRLIRQQN